MKQTYYSTILNKKLKKQWRKGTHSSLTPNIALFESLVSNSDPQDIIRLGQRRALSLFHRAAERVPAYKVFLSKHKINPGKVRTIKDFEGVPLTNKENYILEYPLKSRLWDGSFDHYAVAAVSSGSTGTPLFWPRDIFMEEESILLHEYFLRKYFAIDHHRTLVVVAFYMGMYTAGALTMTSLQGVSARGYPLLTVTPGMNLKDTITAIHELSPDFDQTIIFAYPSLIKDIVDELRLKKFPIRKIKLAFVPAGESFTEQWRSYTAKTSATANDEARVVSLYGCSEKAILGHESSLSIMLRSKIDEYPALRKSLLGSEHTPNIYQYYPFLRYFEAIRRQLVFTAAGGIPLVRYNIHDLGGVLSYEDTLGCLRKAGVPASQLKTHPHLPLLYIEGREKTLTYFGPNIYPQNVTSALESKQLRPFISGRFTLQKRFGSKQKEVLHLYVELADGVKPSKKLKMIIEGLVLKAMCSSNAEYNVVFKTLGLKIAPRVTLFPKWHTRYFKRDGKHKSIIF